MAVLPPDPLFCLKADMGHIHSMCFAGNAENCTDTLLAAAEDGTVYFWDLQKNRIKFRQHMGKAIQVIHSVGEQIITQEKEGAMRLWSLQGAEYFPTKTYQCASGFCKSVLYETSILVPQESNSIDVVSIDTMEVEKRFTTDQSNLGQMMCIETFVLVTQTYIMAGFESGDVIVWEYDSEQRVSHIKLRECITSISFDGLTLRGVCGNTSNALQIFTIDKSLGMNLKCELTIMNEGCNVVKLRGDRKIFVSGGWDGRLRLFSWKSMRLLAVLNEHRGGITDVQYSESPVHLWGNKIMAASSADGIITLWSLYN